MCWGDDSLGQCRVPGGEVKVGSGSGVGNVLHGVSGEMLIYLSGEDDVFGEWVGGGVRKEGEGDGVQDVCALFQRIEFVVATVYFYSRLAVASYLDITHVLISFHSLSI